MAAGCQGSGDPGLGFQGKIAMCSSRCRALAVQEQLCRGGDGGQGSGCRIAAGCQGSGDPELGSRGKESLALVGRGRCAGGGHGGKGKG